VRQAALAAVNVLDVVPVRIADWEDDGRCIVVRRPRPYAAWYLLPLEWLRYALAVRRIRLDPTGSVAWRACDGARPVGAIVAGVRQACGPDAEPVEERLGQLIRRLHKEGLVAYRDFDCIRGPEGRQIAAPARTALP